MFEEKTYVFKGKEDTKKGVKPPGWGGDTLIFLCLLLPNNKDIRKYK